MPERCLGCEGGQKEEKKFSQKHVPSRPRLEPEGTGSTLSQACFRDGVRWEKGRVQKSYQGPEDINSKGGISVSSLDDKKVWGGVGCSETSDRGRQSRNGKNRGAGELEWEGDVPMGTPKGFQNPRSATSIKGQFNGGGGKNACLRGGSHEPNYLNLGGGVRVFNRTPA